MLLVLCEVHFPAGRSSTLTAVRCQARSPLMNTKWKNRTLGLCRGWGSIILGDATVRWHPNPGSWLAKVTEFQIRSSLRFPEGMYHGSDEASLGLSRMKRIICSQGRRLAECFEHFDLAVRSLVLVRQAAADCFNQAFLHFFFTFAALMAHRRRAS